MGRLGMGRNWWIARGGLALAAAMASITPAPAQFSFSDSYGFLKAIRDGDGQKVMDALNKPGNSMLTAYDPSTGETALLIVTKRRDSTYLPFLLGRGADPNTRDKAGVAPLILAAQLGWVEGATTLIQYGARVDLANNSGETPLIIAVRNRDASMVRLLLANNADPKRADRLAGKSALDYAREDPRGGAVLKILNDAPPRRAVSGPQIAGPHQ